MYIHDKSKNRLLKAAREYKKCFSSFLRGSPNPESAESALRKAFEAVMEASRDPGLRADLKNASDKHIGEISEEVLHSTLQDVRDGAEVVKFELSSANTFGFSKEQAKQIIAKLKVVKVEKRSFDEIFERFGKIFEQIIKKVNEARKLPKNQKKSRKRNIERGVLRGLFGICSGTTNLVYMPTFMISYGIALISIQNAIDDLAGEPGDDDQ